MNVTREEFQNMKEEIVKDMIAFRMEDSGCTMQETFNEVYRSKIFEKLCDPDSGLFFQASRYVYAYLLEELRANS